MNHIHIEGKLEVFRKCSPMEGNGKGSDNNVERLRFKMNGAQTYRIRIFASNLSTNILGVL